ncbi:hypothetical protein [Catenovulum sediminis]|uniref:hypothetical protein n=1 Tax=Catenovulum sediminis TaxID=1740262 RepID=UPI00117F3805|nr:hypothetical protein [Catenovulum sediminis]
MLDVEEYLSLAVNASQKQDHQTALECLSKVIELEPDNPLALYLRAAEHAELGLLQRAIDGMESALQIKSDLILARLQLAMLYMQSGNNENALFHFSLVLTSDATEEIKLYAQGLQTHIEGDIESSLDLLSKGVDAPQQFSELRNVIAAFIESEKLKTHDLQDSEDQNITEDTPVFLGAYRSSGDD